MTEAQCLNLARRVKAARAKMCSQNGNHTLRFAAGGDHGYISTNSREVVEVLTALWNAAPELLEELTP